MLPVRGLAEWNIRNDTKQAYPVATGLVRVRPLDPKGALYQTFQVRQCSPNRIIEKSFNEYRKSL